MDGILRPTTAKHPTRNNPLSDAPPPCQNPNCLSLLCLTIGDSNLSESSFYLSQQNALQT